MLSNQCTVCCREDLYRLISFGHQPLSTKFSLLPDYLNKAKRYELGFGICKSCGTMQLVDRFPFIALQEKSPKIQFKEPKDHLAKVVKNLCDNQIVRADSNKLGLTYIDKDLLNNFSHDKGGTLNLVGDIVPQIGIVNTELELIQAQLCKDDTIQFILDQIGKVDFLSVRFLLEHAESARSFLKSICRLVKSNGHILIEVPDASKIINYKNHALIWEDHYTYFTKNTLLNLAKSCGLEIISLDSYSYPFEDVLSLLVKVDEIKIKYFDTFCALSNNSELNLDDFKYSYKIKSDNLHQKIKLLRGSNGVIAIFGAGHHASKFINFYGLAGEIKFVIDDNPQKVGHYMPGTDLEIKKTDFLLNSDVSFCISSLSPDSDAKVRSKIAKYFDAGRYFWSAFSTGDS